MSRTPPDMTSAVPVAEWPIVIGEFVELLIQPRDSAERPQWRKGVWSLIMGGEWYCDMPYGKVTHVRVWTGD